MLTRSRRVAFTLVEILMVMAVLGILAALLYPAVAVQLRRGQTSALANQLNSLRESITNYRSNVTKYPSTLTQLTQQPGVGAVDVCGFALTNANRNAWRGPYLAQNILGDFPVGASIVSNVVGRNPATNAGGPIGLLLIVVSGVDSTSAADLEQQYDGNNNFATGSILWNAAGAGTLTYQIPIRNC